MWKLIASVYMGWALGANDSANCFGPSVGAKAVTYRTATILIAIFVILGAVLEGEKTIHTVGGLSKLTVNGAFMASIIAAFVVNVFTYLKMPVSTTHAIAGAIVGIGLINGQVDWRLVIKVVSAWVTSPLGAMVFSFIFTLLITPLMPYFTRNLVVYRRTVIIGHIVMGSYSAYALGANNLGNVVGVFVGAGLIEAKFAAILGGASIALGALTYSRKVMTTVGSELAKIDLITAFMAILAEALTLHIYAIWGVPVSSSQAVVGAVVGAGLAKSRRDVNFGVLWRIVASWAATSLTACLIAFVLCKILIAVGLSGVIFGG